MSQELIDAVNRINQAVAEGRRVYVRWVDSFAHPVIVSARLEQRGDYYCLLGCDERGNQHHLNSAYVEYYDKDKVITLWDAGWKAEIR
jgi:hypothetical protein